MDITIRSERDLTISPSIDGEYKNELKYEELDDSGFFDPCSSMYRSNWMSQKKSDPELYRFSHFASDSDEPRYVKATNGLFTQELYVQCDDDVYMTLDKDMLLVNEDESKNIARAKEIAPLYPEYTTEELVERLNSLKKCLRVAILVPDENDYHFYVIDPYKEGDTLLGGRQDLEKTGYYSYRVKDEELYETVFGEIKNRDKIVYNEVSNKDSELVGEETSFNARTKAGVHPFDYQKSVDNGMEVVKEESLTLDELEDNIIIPLYNETPKRIVVSIYMEGWDLDCTNAHMGGSFTLGLGFKILREM